MDAKLYVFSGTARGLHGTITIGVKTHQGEGFALDLAKRALVDNEGMTFIDAKKVRETPIDQNSTEEFGVAFIDVKDVWLF